jgi:hypothetical protein
VAIARCTCIYRALPAPAPGQSPVTVITRDPFCPSADRHGRSTAAAAPAPAERARD